MPHLLERQAELQMLDAAIERAATGRGSAVLVLGEAGIGKTSLVQTFLTASAGRARVLVGACEDLLTPRALGPLRDAARSAASGPLAAALSPQADPDLVFAERGGYTSHAAFVGGFVPAMWLAAGLAGVGVLAAVALPRETARVRGLTDPAPRCENDARGAVSAGAAG